MCSVMNEEGKEIGRGRISAKELDGLAPGKKINISHYEIEVQCVAIRPLSLSSP